MANEAEIIQNPTSTPAAMSAGYQRQNTNAVAARVGMDASVVSGGTGKCTLEISGPVDVNGILYTINTSKDFNLVDADRYYIYLNGTGDQLTPTIDTDPGTFDADKNARYTAGGYRVLNWVINYDGTTAVVSKYINSEIDDGDVRLGGNLIIENNLDVGDTLYAGKGRKQTGYIQGSMIEKNDIYDALSPSLPNIGDSRIIIGALELGGIQYFATRVYRYSVSTLLICVYYSSGVGELNISDESTSTYTYVSLSW